MRHTSLAHLSLVGLLAPLVIIQACSPKDEDSGPAVAASRPGYGSVMVDVGRRFEVLGRATKAGRFELAQYELGEITELFEDDLSRASPPREGHPEVLPAMVRDFVHTHVPHLRRALVSKDPAEVMAAFQRSATACNACHEASGHAFIEVPLEPGHAVPNTDPLISR